MKITAIHGGGDWYDASADYLILPDGMDFEKERAAYEQWHRDVFRGAYERGEHVAYLSLFDWLTQRGAVEPTEDQLEIVGDD